VPTSHVEAMPGVLKKEVERCAAVQRTTEEIPTATVSLILARIQTRVVKTLNVKQMVTEQFAVAQEDGLVSHMLGEDALTTLAMKIHAVQMPIAKIRMEMPFVPAGQITKAMLMSAVN